MNPVPIHHGFQTRLAGAGAGGALGEDDLRVLVRTRDPDRVRALFRTARGLRRRHFGDRVFLYGFVYASTFCRNDCAFCGYRRSNPLARRYRKTTAAIVESALRLRASGAHLIDLTLGEDPDLHRPDGAGFDRLADRIARIRDRVGLPLMVSPGVVPDSVIGRMADAGAVWYACYQETHSPELFRRLRKGQSFDRRMDAKRFARTAGLLVEEGILCGVGESADDIVRSFAAMQALDADQVRVMTFVPQPGTSMERQRPPDPLMETVLIAAMRLAFPDRLIPASLDVEGLGGLRRRLLAGANVITSLIPPGQGLAGVVQEALDIDNANRTVAGVRRVLDGCGLSIASGADYDRWIASRKSSRSGTLLKPEPACARR